MSRSRDLANLANNADTLELKRQKVKTDNPKPE